MMINVLCFSLVMFFFFKTTPAYEMRMSDWSSDVCSSDLPRPALAAWQCLQEIHQAGLKAGLGLYEDNEAFDTRRPGVEGSRAHDLAAHDLKHLLRSEEHTSELQSLMRISYAVFCLKKKNTKQTTY